MFFFLLRCIFINNVFARWQSIRESVQKKQFAFVLTTLTVKTLYAGNTRNREGRQKAKAELSEAVLLYLQETTLAIASIATLEHIYPI